MKRAFEYNDEKSHKFWTIETNGAEFTVTFGRVETAGQSQTKSFTDKAACTKEAEKLIREKTKKGYKEADATSLQSSTADAKSMLSKDDYWQLIGTFAKKAKFDTDCYFEIAEKALSALSVCNRYRIGKFSEFYIEHADCTSTDMLCRVVNGYISDDTSLYFNCWVVAQGKEFYLSALKEPDTLAARIPKDVSGYASFEMFVNLGLSPDEDTEAFSDDDFRSWELTEEEIADMEKELVYYGGSRHGNYGAFEDLLRDIPNVFPKLCKKFEFEFDEDDILETPHMQQEPDRATLLLAELEQLLNTEISATLQWKGRIIERQMPKVVGLQRVLPDLFNDHTFLCNIIYCRKKKMKSSLSSIDIHTGEECVLLEDSREMLFKYLAQTEGRIYFSGCYSGAVKLEHNEKGIFILYTLDRKTLALIDQWETTIDPQTYFDKAQLCGSLLYIEKHISSYINGRHKYKNSLCVLDLSRLKSGFATFCKDAHYPTVTSAGMYYLKDNSSSYQYDLYFRPTGSETDQLLYTQVEAYAVTAESLAFIQYSKENNDLKIYHAGRLVRHLVVPGCRFYRLSLSNDVLMFDVSPKSGDPDHGYCIAFYHFDNDEFRVMDAMFLWESQTSGFIAIDPQSFYAQKTEFEPYKDTIFMGDLEGLF